MEAALAEAAIHRTLSRHLLSPYRSAFMGEPAAEKCLGRERSLPLPSSDVTI